VDSFPALRCSQLTFVYREGRQHFSITSMAPRSTTGEDAGMLDDARPHELAQRLTAVTGVVGVALGGSRARGDHAPDSGVDLGLCYRTPLDVAVLRALAREVTGADIKVTEPIAWRPCRSRLTGSSLG
jgi:predicted nucleotidyltransferase